MDKLVRSSDYAGVSAKVINAVAYLLLRFVEYRMNATVGNDYTGAYLFAATEKSGYYRKLATDKRDQFEKALQLDCMHHLHCYLGSAAKLEQSEIASGRADIAVEVGPLRFTIEVKREDNDSSHEALRRKYGGQATEYSNTNVRIGFLLVLDRSRTDGTSGHLTEKFSVQEVQKQGDQEPRLLIIVIMPAKRVRPSGIGSLSQIAAPAATA